MIDLDNQVVIVHPPKTGGMAVQQALGFKMPMCIGDQEIYRHETLRALRRKIPACRDFPTCILVRNPYDRLESWFYFIRIPGTNLPTMNKLREEVIAADSFESYVLSADWNEIFQRPTSMVGQQLKPMFMYLEVDTQGITPIHLERQNEEMSAFLGRDITIKPFNQNPHPPAVWTQKMRDSVYEAFAVDFYQYGYERSGK